MAKISTYATTPPALGDMLIGTDVNDMNSTKNFTIGSLLSIPGSTAYVPYTGALYNVNLGGNDITALGFIVPGGLGTDFLKADGSLDNTSYLSTSTAASTYVPYTGATSNVNLGLLKLTANSLEITTDDVIMQGIQCFSGDFFAIGSNGWLRSGFLVDFANNNYYLGDYQINNNGTFIHVDDTNQQIVISGAIKTNGSVGAPGNILVSQGAATSPTWAVPAYLVPIYGSFYDTTIQGTAGTTQELMQFNSTDLSYGVSIVNDAFGDPNEITFAHTGIYNIQFSAQLKKTGGAGATIFYIYLIKDGIAVPNSATAVTLENNGDLLVAAWNWYIDIPSTPSYCQIGWYANNANGELHYDASPVVGIPAIPSIILTVNKIA
jgi:hypothetical protein